MHLRVKSQVPCKVIHSELPNPCGDCRRAITLLYSLYSFTGRRTGWARETPWSGDIKEEGHGIARLRRARVTLAAIQILLKSGLREATETLEVLEQWLTAQALESDKQDTST